MTPRSLPRRANGFAWEERPAEGEARCSSCLDAAAPHARRAGRIAVEIRPKDGMS
jgi:hypothetical protein